MNSGIFDVIQSDLQELEQALAKTIVTDMSLVTEIVEHLISSGGKRLRPALFLLVARAAKNFSLDRALPLATALELIHTASLVHDDVIDEANTRRNAITANAKWGNRLAILSGDFLFARAFRVVADKHYGDEVNARLADLVCTLSEGEIIQDYTMYQVPTEEEYYERIGKKTAHFLETCTLLGAMVGGMSEADIKKMANYGYYIGMAFQITDDLLDVRHTAEDIGKPAGHDLLEGVVTLPVVRALAELKGTDEEKELRSIVTKPNMSAEDVARALELVRSTKAIDYAQGMADDYLNRAKAILPVDLAQNMLDSFIEVAEFIGNRKF